MKLKYKSLIVLLFFAYLNEGFSQNTYMVTSTSKDGPGSINQAIIDANSTSGVDTIEFTPGLQINATHPFYAGLSGSYMVTIEESVIIDGKGGALNGSQKWVRDDGEVNSLAQCPNSDPNTIVLRRMPGFIDVGLPGNDNSAITVTVKNLSIKQFSHIASVRENATLNLENFNANQIWASLECSNIGFLKAATGASISIKDSQITSSANWSPHGVGHAIESGFNAGDLTIENCLFYEINDGNQFLISWNGAATSKINIVSSRLLGVGGLEVYGATSETNFVNSTMTTNSTGTPGVGERILNFSSGPLNITASSIKWNSNSCSSVSCPFSPQILIESNPGLINLKGTAIGFNFPETTGTLLATLGEGGGGGFTADENTWIEPTLNQDATALKNITSQTGLITATPGFKTGIQAQAEYNDVELVAPDFSGVLIDIITTPLINPIDNSLITKDVVGNERFDANAKRDIGAIKLALAPGLTLTNSGDQFVDLSWQEPLHHSNAAIIRYELQYVANGGSPTVVDAGLILTANIAGLTNGTTYEFSVRAVYNEGGSEVNGPYGNVVTTIPFGALEALNPIATEGDTEVTLNWSIPDLGGRTFEVYDILWRVQGAQRYTDAMEIIDINQTSATITGLTNGTTYEFATFVRASGKSSSWITVLATPNINLGVDNYDIFFKNFTFYPNPTEDLLFIKTDEPFKAQLFSIEGVLVQDTFNNKTVDMSNYARGVYLLKISYNGDLYTKKIIKN